MPETATATVGLIAGNGRFPLLAAKEARRQGKRVVVCALQGETDTQIETLADVCSWVKLGEIGKLVRFFKKEGVSQVLMAGKIEKVKLFGGNVQPDFEMLKVLMKIRDFKDDSLLGAIADYLGREGIQVLDSTIFLSSALPGEGALGQKKPTKEMLEDIQFGFEMAKAVAGLDIGQTLVIKKKSVLAVEAIEGTDAAIQRGGALGSGGVVVVKVAKPNQDMRFDVPAIGLKTMESLIEARAEALAFEAGKTIIMDQAEFIRIADKNNMVVFGMKGIA